MITIRQQDLMATKKEFFESMAAYSPQQLRLPLQIALLISPLILLSSSELHKAGWDRRKLILVGINYYKNIHNTFTKQSHRRPKL